MTTAHNELAKFKFTANAETKQTVTNTLFDENLKFLKPLKWKGWNNNRTKFNAFWCEENTQFYSEHRMKIDSILPWSEFSSFATVSIHRFSLKWFDSLMMICCSIVILSSMTCKCSVFLIIHTLCVHLLIIAGAVIER